MMNLPCGSLQYAAPEVLQTQEYMGELIDIWSVGVMLFCLVNGDLPFKDSSQRLTVVLKEILQNEELPFKSGISESVKDLIRGMLQVHNK